MVNNFIMYRKQRINLKFFYHNKILLKHLKFNNISINKEEDVILKPKRNKLILNLLKNLFFFNKFNLKTLSRLNLIKICMILLEKNIKFLFYVPL
jgi:hypothetical protein